MEAVKEFNAELCSLYELQPPISKAKMTQITKAAIKAIKLYKHVVQSVEKFIQKCRQEYKVPGLYIIDSIIRQSRKQFGADKDMFAPRFSKNIVITFHNLFECATEDISKMIRVLNLWQKNGVYHPGIIQPLLDLASDPYNPAVFETVQKQVEEVTGLTPSMPLKCDQKPPALTADALQLGSGIDLRASSTADLPNDLSTMLNQLIQTINPPQLTMSSQQMQTQLLQQLLLQQLPLSMVAPTTTTTNYNKFPPLTTNDPMKMMTSSSMNDSSLAGQIHMLTQQLLGNVPTASVTLATSTPTTSTVSMLQHHQQQHQQHQHIQEQNQQQQPYKKIEESKQQFSDAGDSNNDRQSNDYNYHNEDDDDGCNNSGADRYDNDNADNSFSEEPKRLTSLDKRILSMCQGGDGGGYDYNNDNADEEDDDEDDGQFKKNDDDDDHEDDDAKEDHERHRCTMNESNTGYGSGAEPVSASSSRRSSPMSESNDDDDDNDNQAGDDDIIKNYSHQNHKSLNDYHVNETKYDKKSVEEDKNDDNHTVKRHKKHKKYNSDDYDEDENEEEKNIRNERRKSKSKERRKSSKRSKDHAGDDDYNRDDNDGDDDGGAGLKKSKHKKKHSNNNNESKRSSRKNNSCNESYDDDEEDREDDRRKKAKNKRRSRNRSNSPQEAKKPKTGFTVEYGTNEDDDDDDDDVIFIDIQKKQVDVSRFLEKKLPPSPMRKRQRSTGSRSRSSSVEYMGRDARSKVDRSCMPPIVKEMISVCSITLWIGRLNKLTGEDEIRNELDGFGEVSINLVPPRGCAFVTFTTRKYAHDALERLRTVHIQGNLLKVAWANGVGVKNSQFASEFNVDKGVNYIPWSKIPSVNFVSLLEGSVLDDDTLPANFDRSRLLRKKDRKKKIEPTKTESKSNTDAIQMIPLPQAMPPLPSIPPPPLPPINNENHPIPNLVTLDRGVNNFNQQQQQHIMQQQPHQQQQMLQQQQQTQQQPVMHTQFNPNVPPPFLQTILPTAPPTSQPMGQGLHTFNQQPLTQSDSVSFIELPKPINVVGGSNTVLPATVLNNVATTSTQLNVLFNNPPPIFTQNIQQQHLQQQQQQQHRLQHQFQQQQQHHLQQQQQHLQQQMQHPQHLQQPLQHLQQQLIEVRGPTPINVLHTSNQPVQPGAFLIRTPVVENPEMLRQMMPTQAVTMEGTLIQHQQHLQHPPQQILRSDVTGFQAINLPETHVVGILPSGNVVLQQQPTKINILQQQHVLQHHQQQQQHQQKQQQHVTQQTQQIIPVQHQVLVQQMDESQPVSKHQPPPSSLYQQHQHQQADINRNPHDGPLHPLPPVNIPPPTLVTTPASKSSIPTYDEMDFRKQDDASDPHKHEDYYMSNYHMQNQQQHKYNNRLGANSPYNTQHHQQQRHQQQHPQKDNFDMNKPRKKPLLETPILPGERPVLTRLPHPSQILNRKNSNELNNDHETQVGLNVGKLDDRPGGKLLRPLLNAPPPPRSSTSLLSSPLLPSLMSSSNTMLNDSNDSNIDVETSEKFTPISCTGDVVSVTSSSFQPQQQPPKQQQQSTSQQPKVPDNQPTFVPQLQNSNPLAAMLNFQNNQLFTQQQSQQLFNQQHHILQQPQLMQAPANNIFNNPAHMLLAEALKSITQSPLMRLPLAMNNQSGVDFMAVRKQMFGNNNNLNIRNNPGLLANYTRFNNVNSFINNNNKQKVESSATVSKSGDNLVKVVLPGTFEGHIGEALANVEGHSNGQVKDGERKEIGSGDGGGGGNGHDVSGEGSLVGKTSTNDNHAKGTITSVCDVGNIIANVNCNQGDDGVNVIDNDNNNKDVSLGSDDKNKVVNIDGRKNIDDGDADDKMKENETTDGDNDINK